MKQRETTTNNCIASMELGFCCSIFTFTIYLQSDEKNLDTVFEFNKKTKGEKKDRRKNILSRSVYFFSKVFRFKADIASISSQVH